MKRSPSTLLNVEKGIPLLGDRKSDPKTDRFELRIYDYIDKVGEFDPRLYFVTSGEAVCKIDYMIKVLQGLKLKKQLKQARELRKKLIAARGDNLWFETEWRDHKLICRHTNPRDKSKERKVATSYCP